MLGDNVLARLVIPGSLSDLYLCLPCLALPLCWESFLYLIFFVLSVGMTLLFPPQYGPVFLLCCSFGLDARYLLPIFLLSALRASRSELLTKIRPCEKEGVSSRALHLHLRLTLVFTFWLLGRSFFGERVPEGECRLCCMQG